MNCDHDLNVERSPEFSRNQALEFLLEDLNSILWISEKALLGGYETMQFPLILIVGPHRSGTTLFMQWLSNTGVIAYPSNLLSRFYQAPILGAKIQLLLTDSRYNFRDELGEFRREAEYKSENGKTKGVLAPNEFWYFWRRFLAEPERDVWTDNELRSTMDTRTMVAELNGMMDVFNKPFAAKGMLFNYNIPFLNSIFPKILFIQIKRDPVANIKSILDARNRQYGSSSTWYSFKIPEYNQLRNLSPLMQTAGQLHYINKAVELGIKSIPESRRMVVEYERFCLDPRSTYMKICEKLGIEFGSYTGPDQFSETRIYNPQYDSEVQTAINFFL